MRLFVVAFDPTQPELDEDQPAKPFAIINPEITPLGDEIVEDWEGCLSIPDIRGRVPRLRQLRLRAHDWKGERFELRLQNFQARVIQHENDHLDGVLFFDRMRSFERLRFCNQDACYWSKDRD